MQKSYKMLLFPMGVLTFMCIFFIPVIYSTDNVKFNTKLSDTNGSFFTISSGYAWPVPGYNNISSKYGPRKAPTAGASTFHSGIDIPAPSGTNLVSIADGKVISVGWAGSAGYAVSIECSEFTITYCHVNPNFLVHAGQTIKKGKSIAQVGPLNVYNIPNNPYKDSKGNPTNGATTRMSPSFDHKKRWKSHRPSYIILNNAPYYRCCRGGVG